MEDPIFIEYRIDEFFIEDRGGDLAPGVHDILARGDVRCILGHEVVQGGEMEGIVEFKELTEGFKNSKRFYVLFRLCLDDGAELQEIL